MHPGPMNRGVEIDSPVADGAQSVILPQVTFGIAVRMAVMSIVAGERRHEDPIKNGRVIDPASGRDEICDLAIAAGRMLAIKEHCLQLLAQPRDRRRPVASSCPGWWTWRPACASRATEHGPGSRRRAASDDATGRVDHAVGGKARRDVLDGEDAGVSNGHVADFVAARRPGRPHARL